MKSLGLPFEITIVAKQGLWEAFHFLSSRRAFRAVRGPDAKAAARVRDCSRAFPHGFPLPSRRHLRRLPWPNGGKPGKLSSVLLAATENSGQHPTVW